MSRLAVLVSFCLCLVPAMANAPTDIRMDEKARNIHRIDSINILVYTVLLILTVCLIWAFKRRRARFLHETGLAVIFGLIVGASIRYASEETETSHLRVIPLSNQTLPDPGSPPDNVFVQLEIQKTPDGSRENRSYAYTFRGELTDVESKKLDQKATFDPEIFFNIILPPIIFNAGYSLKRKFFFRNLGTIMTYAFFGTTISCFVTGSVLYIFVLALPHLQFTFNNCLYFGAIISATDPVTVLAIFHDLQVDVNLYALVFGESILNDAVAIGLVSAITSYEDVSNKATEFELAAALKAFSNFFYIFACSFLIGSSTGCVTALITKFTKLCDFPLLESCLFLLMSYSSFLVAEALELTGIVAVLFCGICQAHYTYNNLSVESRQRTKQLFELMNFVAENFIFSYIGVSMFTYKKHHWDLFFILAAFISIAAGRAMLVYPLTFLLNLGRTNKIPMAFQHVIFFSGLRGAMAFALAIRNTLGLQRHVMLTTTSFTVIVSVIVCGGSMSTLLRWLNIPVGSEDHDQELLNITAQQRAQSELRSPSGDPLKTPYEKAWLVRKWYNFDVRFMKPFLTHSRPTLIETLPSCCMPLAHLLTSTEQLTQKSNGFKSLSTACIVDSSGGGGGGSVDGSEISEAVPHLCASIEQAAVHFHKDDTCRHTRDDDSDTDLCLDESDFNFERTNSLTQASQALVNHVYYIEK